MPWSAAFGRLSSGGLAPVVVPRPRPAHPASSRRRTDASPDLGQDEYRCNEAQLNPASFEHKPDEYRQPQDACEAAEQAQRAICRTVKHAISVARARASGSNTKSVGPGR